MTGPSKRIIPNSWTHKLVPFFLAVLILVLLAVLVIIGLSLMGGGLVL